MAAFLVALRDALIVIAMSWLGITLAEQNSVRAPASEPAKSAAPCAGATCASAPPSFSALDCDPS